MVRFKCIGISRLVERTLLPTRLLDLGSISS